MSHCDTCYVDNQGLCHKCGRPMNSDWGITYFGEAAWQEIVDRWNDSHATTEDRGL
jgi:hypothetical protein